MSETKVEQPVQAAARLNREGKFSEALALVAPLVEKGDKQPIAYLQMSRALRGMKDDKAAREVETRALELFPDNLRVVAHVGNFLVSTDRDFAKAVELVSPPLAAGRVEPDLVVIASIALRALKRDSEADAIENKGLAAHPDNAQLLARRMTILNRGGKFADAVALLAGKDAVVEASASLKTQLQNARDGLAADAAKPAGALGSKAEAAPSVAESAASSVAAKPASAAGSASGPVSAPASRPTTPAVAAAPAAEVPKPTSQSVPVTTPARPASAPSPTSGPAQSGRASQPATSSNAAVASIPTVPTPVAQSTQPLAKAPAPPPPVSRQPEVQQTAAKSTQAAAGNSSTAGQSAAARQTTGAPAGGATSPRPQSPVPARSTYPDDYAEAKVPRSGISAFGVIFWGVVIVAAGLAVAYFADLIDLAPFFQQVSAMIEAARNN